jgi:hypothetical protein
VTNIDGKGDRCIYIGIYIYIYIERERRVGGQKNCYGKEMRHNKRDNQAKMVFDMDLLLKVRGEKIGLV